MKRALAVMVLCVGCDSEPSCDLDEVVERYVGDAAVTDCGTVVFVDGVATDALVYATARSCVRVAESRQEPFIVRWSRAARQDRFVGLARDGVYEVSTFAMDGAPPTTRSTCEALADLGECDRPSESLCLACENATPEERCP